MLYLTIKRYGTPFFPLVSCRLQYMRLCYVGKVEVDPSTLDHFMSLRNFFNFFYIFKVTYLNQPSERNILFQEQAPFLFAMVGVASRFMLRIGVMVMSGPGCPDTFLKLYLSPVPETDSTRVPGLTESVALAATASLKRGATV